MYNDVLMRGLTMQLNEKIRSAYVEFFGNDEFAFSVFLIPLEVVICCDSMGHKRKKFEQFLQTKYGWTSEVKKWRTRKDSNGKMEYFIRLGK